MHGKSRVLLAPILLFIPACFELPHVDLDGPRVVGCSLAGPRSVEVPVQPTIVIELSEPLDPDTWIVRVHYKPFVSWIWGGCLLMALGGLLAASDRRYRVGAREPQPAPYAAQAGAARQ